MNYSALSRKLTEKEQILDNISATFLVVCLL